MAAHIVRLRTKPQRLKAEAAERARQAVLDLRMPEPIEAAMLDTIDRHAEPDEDWSFVLVSQEQFIAVSRWLRKHSARPKLANALWDEMFAVYHGKTGEVRATREELAEMVGCHPNHVSLIVGELERIGAIIRRIERVPGMRGQGRARYFMNPNVSTSLGLKAREKAQAAAPKLRVVPAG